MENEKFEFVTNAFHELKSPLTTIILASEIIKSRNIDKNEIDEYAKMIFNESIRMKNIINNTIDSLKNNYFDIDISQNCDINEILGKIVNNSMTEGIELFLMASKHRVKGNVGYLESAFRELIENAKKNRSEQPFRLNINTFNKGNKVKIRFSDNGVGIQKNKLNEIFEKGYSDNNAIENQRSTGLGLYFLKRNIQRINGAITVESKTGRGSTFTITLPIIV